jgi:hypothetical protein
MRGGNGGRCEGGLEIEIELELDIKRETRRQEGATNLKKERRTYLGTKSPIGLMNNSPAA